MLAARCRRRRSFGKVGRSGFPPRKAYGENECLHPLSEAGHQDVEIDRYKNNWLLGLMTAARTKKENPSLSLQATTPSDKV